MTMIFILTMEMDTSMIEANEQQFGWTMLLYCCMLLPLWRYWLVVDIFCAFLLLLSRFTVFIDGELVFSFMDGHTQSNALVE